MADETVPVLELLPLLQTQRGLLDVPPGRERFERYVRAMLGDTGDIVLPLALFNPMAKPHVAACLDALIALGAEEVAAAAVDQAAARLRGVTGQLRVGLVLADDAQGGWTDRYLTEAQHRFQNQGEQQRGFATALLWSSEATTREGVRAEVLAAIYRAFYHRRHGLPLTLRQMLTQEAFASTFAEMTSPALDPLELRQVRRSMAPHLDATSYPVAFACLYGDTAAESVGYPTLGFPARAGFAVALAEGRERDPVAALLGETSPT